MAVLVAAYRGQRAQRHPGLPGRIGSALIVDCLIVKRFEGGRVLS